MSPQAAVRLFDLLARLPLCVLQWLGGVAGWLAYLFSGSYAAHLRGNLALGCRGQTPEACRKIRNASIAGAGRGLFEIPWIWRRPLPEVLASVRACHGWEHVEAAQKAGKGIIFLTPHLGCFEVSALYAAARLPITVLYRPPKLHWLEEVMRSGRMRGNLFLARTDIGGVRLLYKALKRGEAIGLLPDQVPGKGEGEWANFFGRPAYTMSLVGRLAEHGNAAVLMAYAERLSNGGGYVIRIAPLDFDPGVPAAAQLNAALETVVRACPAQYLWGYNRYKAPPGATPPPGAAES